MKSAGGSEAAKRRAGERAAASVENATVVGLGTGSTAAYAIDAVGRAVAEGLETRAIPTSYQSRQLALDAGIPLTCLDAVEGVDLAIDGADQVVSIDAEGGREAAGALVKGGGAAHAREKVVAAAADRFVVVVDDSKLAGALDRPVPVEVLPAARSVVADRIDELGGESTLRAADRKDGPVVTDNGNLVLDCDFGRIESPRSLASRLSGVAGVVEHGLFVGMADATYVGTADGVEIQRY